MHALELLYRDNFTEAQPPIPGIFADEPIEEGGPVFHLLNVSAGPIRVSVLPIEPLYLVQVVVSGIEFLRRASIEGLFSPSRSAESLALTTASSLASSLEACASAVVPVTETIPIRSKFLTVGNRTQAHAFIELFTQSNRI